MSLQTLAPWLLAGLLVATPAHAVDDKFAAETAREVDAVNLSRDTQAGGYALLTAGEVKKMLDAGTPLLLIDTMPFEASYRKEHLPGAQNFVFPVARMSVWDTQQTDGKSSADFAAFLGADKDRPLVFYCGFVKCTRSDNAAAWARKLGYTQVYRFPGGLFAWKGAELPLEALK